MEESEFIFIFFNFSIYTPNVNNHLFKNNVNVLDYDIVQRKIEDKAGYMYISHVYRPCVKHTSPALKDPKHR